MEVFVDTVALGSVVCKCCGEIIDTIQAEKVMIYYSHCNQESCVDQVELEK